MVVTVDMLLVQVKLILKLAELEEQDSDGAIESIEHGSDDQVLVHSSHDEVDDKYQRLV
jgi:hypothetical protein